MKNSRSFLFIIVLLLVLFFYVLTAYYGVPEVRKIADDEFMSVYERFRQNYEKGPGRFVEHLREIDTPLAGQLMKNKVFPSWPEFKKMERYHCFAIAPFIVYSRTYGSEDYFLSYFYGEELIYSKTMRPSRVPLSMWISDASP